MGKKQKENPLPLCSEAIYFIIVCWCWSLADPEIPWEAQG